MVKLQKTKNGSYVISIPLEKVKRKGWQKGQEFDVEFNEHGSLVLVPIMS
ncbi:MAG TPA: hypothetical protein VJB94_01550 [Candidatus Nanoarchaeia archaeon]|nr:hypothetical protein [Candidatus Nanoarchaeia archaeon]